MEIERKFLLRALPPGFETLQGTPIAQGYLAVEPGGRQVRLRKKGTSFFLTAKSAPKGYARDEIEIELTPAQFDALWPLTGGRRLTKKRFEAPFGGRTVEIDVYGGKHQGLVVAEVEFESEAAAHAFAPPEWFAEDISARPEYSNRNLASE
ncbi:MAG: CYTH domain-containing protein [Verrucomicrobiota bacterium]